MVDKLLSGLALVAIALATAGCGGPAVPSDTGFNGTWGKETSTVQVAMYIWHDGQEYRFRMWRESRDGVGRITCDWDGHCEEFLNDQKTSDLQFSLQESAAPGNLLLHCEGTVFHPRELAINYTHELSLTEDRLTLVSHTVESQGNRYEGDARGKRELAKISDAVPEPPAARVTHGS